ncbi:KEOPS complex subunit Cgi121 [Candidatus Nitrosocosmicus franklandus]|uniref:Kinase binding protein CGI-121 n=1 Tax=Candidatus Nitrosocosmicus franklandianus TaxID=1798806 RepID=A0A484I7Y6_9ARCH|nr:KEOPS complex subunit Cgi121 [Candidatus Nitrosocosmicus franklandus]VFJ12863.1 conserved protein of unknown function [Candidatus Nitrosocosmicus franklandus]
MSNIITVGGLKARVFVVAFFDSNVKRVYEEIKKNSDYNNLDLIFVNAHLVFGIEHIIGIMKIINERKRRNIVSEIKNLEVEFLMRICCTDQISEALRLNFGDKSNKDFVIIILTDDNNSQKLMGIEKEFERYGTVKYASKEKNDNNGITSYQYDSRDKEEILIPSDNSKRDYIINTLFKEKIKAPRSELFTNDIEFLKFLVERAAISLG